MKGSIQNGFSLFSVFPLIMIKLVQTDSSNNPGKLEELYLGTGHLNNDTHLNLSLSNHFGLKYFCVETQI